MSEELFNEGFNIYFPVFALSERPVIEADLVSLVRRPPIIYMRGDKGQIQCIALFTDQDLVTQWRRDTNLDVQLCHIKIANHQEMAQYLNLLTTEATHVVMDPDKDRARSNWIVPLPYFTSLVESSLNS